MQIIHPGIAVTFVRVPALSDRRVRIPPFLRGEHADRFRLVYSFVSACQFRFTANIVQPVRLPLFSRRENLRTSVGRRRECWPETTGDPRDDGGAEGQRGRGRARL